MRLRIALAALALVAPLAVPAAAIDAKTEPRQAIADAYRALTRLKSYRIRSTTSGKTTSTTVFEYLAPDRYRMTTERAETVVTPGATYVRYKGGRWAIAPVDVSELIARFRDPKELREVEDAEQSKDFRALGTDALDGINAYVYQYATGVAGQATLAKVWIGAESGLLLKRESEAGYGAEKVRSVQTFDYDRDIMIDPPIHG
jgi:outer membrane lipoprotein-sorting protein